MNEDEALEHDELMYERGSRMAWLHMLGECLRHLGYDSDEGKRLAWITERELAISTLRQVCDEFGDNDWEPDLNLSDIIEKHLWRNLED